MELCHYQRLGGPGGTRPGAARISNRESVMFKHLFILISAVAVSGCASMFTPASEPKDGERARLRGVGGTFFVDQNVCGDRPDLANGMFVYLNSPFWQRSIGMPRGAMSTPVWGEMYIRADRQVQVTANYAAGRSNCEAVSYFKPEKNRDYEFTIGYSGHNPIAGRSSCNLRVADITSGRDRRPVQISREKLPCH